MNLRFPVVATFSVLVLSSCFLAKPLHEKTVNLTVSHVPNQNLQVESVNGRIEVRRGPNEDETSSYSRKPSRVEVTGVIRAQSPERLEATTLEAIRDGSGELRIRPVWPDGKRRSNEGCGITVAIPGVSGLDLESSNGSVKASGFSGDARLKTSNGSITLEDHSGPVRATTSNGSVKVDGRLGDVELRSSNGKIVASGLSGEVDAKTSNGSITLALDSDFGGTLDLSTSNGSVKIDSDLESAVVSRTKKKAATLRIGGQQTRSKARTSNGSIRVERR